jgi:large subunit ribosomal protein L3
MKFIIGKKLDMTQVWQGDKAMAVTRIQAGPCKIVQIKSDDNDGYKAAVVGYGEKKEKNIKKPQKGQLKGLGNIRYLKEFRLDNQELKRGDIIDVSTFASGDIIKVTARSKGKGFQGVVKRHHFHGHNKTHGTKDQERSSGSIGPKGPAHVFKGTRMGGHMGDEMVTTKNLEIAGVDFENNILLIKGAVPGARNGLVMIQGEGDLKIRQDAGQESPIENTDKKETMAEPETVIESANAEPAKDSE